MSDDWYREDGQLCPCCGGNSWGQTPGGVIECTNCWWNEAVPAAVYRRRLAGSSRYGTAGGQR